MVKAVQVRVVLLMLWLTGMGTAPVLAQTPGSIVELDAQMRQAYCAQDWLGAIELAAQILRSLGTTQTYRRQVESFKQQLEELRGTTYTFEQLSGCDRVLPVGPMDQEVEESDSPVIVSER